MSIDFEYNRTIDFGLEDKPIFYLEETCGACPESWNVYTEEDGYLGYLYVRHGSYTVWDTGDNQVYCNRDIKGDGLFDYDEREHYMKIGCVKLYNTYKDKQIKSEDYFNEY